MKFKRKKPTFGPRRVVDLNDEYRKIRESPERVLADKLVSLAFSKRLSREQS